MAAVLRPPNGGAPGQDLVEDGSHRIEIGSCIEHLQLNLLGCDGVGGAAADQRPLDPLAAGAPGELRGQAEVDDTRTLVFVDDDVGRLEVAMDQPLSVEVGERVAEAPNDPEEPSERACRDAGSAAALGLPYPSAVVVEGWPVHQLHRVPGRVVVEAFVEDGDDAWMIETGHRMDLSPKQGGLLAVSEGHRLQGDEATGLSMNGPIDDPSAPRPQDPLNVVASDLLSGVGGGTFGGEVGW